MRYNTLAAFACLPSHRVPGVADRVIKPSYVLLKLLPPVGEAVSLSVFGCTISLADHHIRLDNQFSDIHGALSYYHYTAIFTDGDERYKLHVYFGRHHQVMRVDLNYHGTGAQNEAIELRNVDTAPFIGLATVQALPLIQSLCEMHRQQVGREEQHVQGMLRNMGDLSSDMAANQDAWLEMAKKVVDYIEPRQAYLGEHSQALCSYLQAARKRLLVEPVVEVVQAEAAPASVEENGSVEAVVAVLKPKAVVKAAENMNKAIDALEVTLGSELDAAGLRSVRAEIQALLMRLSESKDAVADAAHMALLLRLDVDSRGRARVLLAGCIEKNELAAAGSLVEGGELPDAAVFFEKAIMTADLSLLDFVIKHSLIAMNSHRFASGDSVLQRMHAQLTQPDAFDLSLALIFELRKRDLDLMGLFQHPKHGPLPFLYALLCDVDVASRSAILKAIPKKKNTLKAQLYACCKRHQIDPAVNRLLDDRYAQSVSVVRVSDEFLESYHRIRRGVCQVLGPAKTRMMDDPELEAMGDEMVALSKKLNPGAVRHLVVSPLAFDPEAFCIFEYATPAEFGDFLLSFNRAYLAYLKAGVAASSCGQMRGGLFALNPNAKKKHGQVTKDLKRAAKKMEVIIRLHIKAWHERTWDNFCKFEQTSAFFFRTDVGQLAIAMHFDTMFDYDWKTTKHKNTFDLWFKGVYTKISGGIVLKILKICKAWFPENTLGLCGEVLEEHSDYAFQCMRRAAGAYRRHNGNAILHYNIARLVNVAILAGDDLDADYQGSGSSLLSEGWRVRKQFALVEVKGHFQRCFIGMIDHEKCKRLIGKIEAGQVLSADDIKDCAALVKAFRADDDEEEVEYNDEMIAQFARYASDHVSAHCLPQLKLCALDGDGALSDGDASTCDALLVLYDTLVGQEKSLALNEFYCMYAIYKMARESIQDPQLLATRRALLSAECSRLASDCLFAAQFLEQYPESTVPGEAEDDHVEARSAAGP